MVTRRAILEIFLYGCEGKYQLVDKQPLFFWLRNFKFFNNFISHIITISYDNINFIIHFMYFFVKRVFFILLTNDSTLFSPAIFIEKNPHTRVLKVYFLHFFC